MGIFNGSAEQNSRIRKPAVAGPNNFYTSNAADLKRQIESYLANGKKLATFPQMLISPHAGYVFSGPVAAMGYATIDKKVNTVILLGPPHHAIFSGISILDVDSFETPLGRVPLAASIVKKLRENKMVQSVPQADLPEHSVEVQIPFLQMVLPSFSIVPILTGRVNPADVADLLIPYVNSTTLVVASSDFSHFLTAAEARTVDDKSIKAILAGDENGDIEACGELPIRVVMHMAKKLSLTPQLIDARTSFDTAPQYGDDRVVGYASIAYVKKNPLKK